MRKIVKNTPKTWSVSNNTNISISITNYISSNEKIVVKINNLVRTWRDSPKPLPIEAMEEDFGVFGDHGKQILLRIPLCNLNLREHKEQEQQKKKN